MENQKFTNSDSDRNIIKEIFGSSSSKNNINPEINQYISDLVSQINDGNFAHEKIQGMIPDMIFRVKSDQSNENNYSKEYVSIFNSNSNRDDNLGNGCSAEDGYRPVFSDKNKQYTDQKCSFNFIANNKKLAINSPYFDNKYAKTDSETIREFTCYDIENNTTLLLLNPDAEIKENLFETATQNQTIQSFDSENTENNFLIKIENPNNPKQRAGSTANANIVFVNNDSDGYKLNNIEIEQCIDNGDPYLKIDGKWHGETTCLASIDIDLADDPTTEKTWKLPEFTEFVPFKPNKDTKETSFMKLVVDKPLNDGSTSSDKYITANDGSILHIHVGEEEGDYGYIALNDKLSPRQNMVIDASEQPGNPMITILTPTNYKRPMTTSNITILPCDDRHPFLFQDGKPYLDVKCPLNNEVLIEPSDKPTLKRLWNIKSSDIEGCENHLAYLLFDSYFVYETCDSGFCGRDVNKIHDSHVFPGWLRINAGKDRHGIYYDDGDLSYDHLNEMSVFDSGIVVTDVQILNECNKCKPLLLVKVETKCDPIIFNQTLFTGLPENHNIDSNNQINFTPLDCNGSPTKSLYHISRNIDHNTVIADYYKEFTFTNSDGDIMFSVNDLDLYRGL